MVYNHPRSYYRDPSLFVRLLRGLLLHLLRGASVFVRLDHRQPLVLSLRRMWWRWEEWAHLDMRLGRAREVLVPARRVLVRRGRIVSVLLAAQVLVFLPL